MIRNFFLIAIVVTATISCDKDGTDETLDGFDRGAMLVNMADNIIIPAYTDLDSKLTELEIATGNFTSNTNQSTLDDLRTAWFNAYKTWQYVEMFNIGKAEEINYYFKMNTYPSNITEIEANIASGTADLTHVNNFDAIGFPAVDYLIFNVADTDMLILEQFSTHTDAAKHKTYLTNVVSQMASLTKTILTDWTGSYRDTFVNSTDNTATSSVNTVVNDFVFYYEKGLRTNKIGIPAGIFSATPLPTKVEAYHKNDVSRELTLEALKAVEAVFNGTHYKSTTSGESFKSYLENLDNAALASSINSQFEITRDKIQLMDASFSVQIETDNAKMTESFDALQVAVKLLKVDMLHAFDINVDFSSGDGD